jgi:signal peptidase I
MTGEEEIATSPEPGPGQAQEASPEDPRSGESRSTADGTPKHRSFWRELPVLVVVALVIALLIKTFVVQAFYIPSGSMQNTLKIGDKVLVSKLTYHFRPIQPGDVIVFDGAGSWDAAPVSRTSADPVVRVYDATLGPLLHSIGGLFGTAPGQTDYIKRVIGVPGDHVACCNAQGRVTIDGVALHEHSYLFPGNRPGDSAVDESGHFSLTVPPGRLWVLGDHRSISADSRAHVADPGDGTIPESQVIGRAFMIVWPPSRWRALPIPGTFLQRGIAGQASALSGSAMSGSAMSGSAPLGSALSGSALRGSGLRGAVLGGRLRPGSPYLPLGAGVVGALPVTVLRRRWRARSNWHLSSCWPLSSRWPLNSRWRARSH